MSQRPEFLDKDYPPYVCKLPKTIYGLKHAPRAWYQELRSFLLFAGIRRSIADPFLSIYRHNELPCIFLFMFMTLSTFYYCSSKICLPFSNTVLHKRSCCTILFPRC